jgi:glucokinase
MSRQLIGVDVGGTKTAVASLRDGVLDEPQVFATEKVSSKALIDQIAASVRAVRGPDTIAVGVGVPSVIDILNERVRTSVNIPLADVPLRSALEQRLDLHVVVDNDANCAALAEAYEGERIAVQNLVMLTVGTGIGGGLVLGGRLYRGATGAAGELGHTLIGAESKDGAPPAVAFPQPGSLEALASGRALEALALAGSFAGAGELVDAARDGDANARRVIALIGERLGIGIANAINTFDPDEVVIGGGIAAGTGELLLAAASETARRFTLPGVGEETEIRLARHGALAGVRGAALLALHEIELAPHDTRAQPQRQAAGARLSRVRDAFRIRGRD